MREFFQHGGLSTHKIQKRSVITLHSLSPKIIHAYSHRPLGNFCSEIRSLPDGQGRYFCEMRALLGDQNSIPGTTIAKIAPGLRPIALFFPLIGVIRGCHPREISTSFDVRIS
jgi:hypothetical protein